jgi:hypothetical protein
LREGSGLRRAENAKFAECGGKATTTSKSEYLDAPLKVKDMVKTDDLLGRLDRVLEVALVTATPSQSIPAIAEEIYDSEPELIKELSREWMTGRLTSLLYQKRQRRAHEDECWLPGMEDLAARLPRRMHFEDGTRVDLRKANLLQLRIFRKELARRRDKRLAYVDRLIEVVEPFSRETYGITVDQVAAKLR